MIENSQELLSTRHVDDIAVSLDGRIGIHVSRLDHPRHLLSDAGYSIPIVARLEPDDPEFAVLFVIMEAGWPRELNDAMHRWKLDVTDALLVLSTVAMGDYLDRSGRPIMTVGSELPQLRLAEVIDKLRHRKKASYDEILTYLKGKVFWSWEFRHPIATITRADLLRLNSDLKDLNEVVYMRVGDFWSVTIEGRLKPTARLIDVFDEQVREQRVLHDDHILCAILFADIVDSTLLMREGEDFAIRLIEVFEAIAREHVSTWKGTVVKFTGDGMVARFPSVPGAVQCGLDLMEDFARKASDLGHRGELRVGINMGEVVFSSDGDVHGDVVHIAARVQAAAPRGTLVITEEAWIQLKRSLRFKAQDLGEYELKNVEVPVRLYAIQRS